jgi:hypothetical protein
MQIPQAIPYLIDSLTAAFMNIGIAADDSLRQLFPGAPQFDSAEQAQKYYRRKAAAGPKPKNKSTNHTRALFR